MKEMLMRMCSRGAVNSIRLFGEESNAIRLESVLQRKIRSRCWVYFAAFVRVRLSPACLVRVHIQMQIYLKADFFVSCVESALATPFIIIQGVYRSYTSHKVLPCLVGRMAMHAYQIGPTDTALPCSGSLQLKKYLPNTRYQIPICTDRRTNVRQIAGYFTTSTLFSLLFELAGKSCKFFLVFSLNNGTHRKYFR